MKSELLQEEACEYGIDVPKWIEQDVTLYDLDAINYGGCASGAYMPAVTYYNAQQTMAEHGDTVLEFIADTICDEMVLNPHDTTWGGFCVHVLSRAVEAFAASVDTDDLLVEWGESLDDRLSSKYGDRYENDWIDWTDVGESSWFGWVGFDSESYLVHADSFESAYEIAVDLADTVPAGELHEAYGITAEQLAAYDSFAPVNLVEGYEYQSNSTGTGVVFTGYHTTCEEIKTLEQLEEVVG